MLKNRERDLVYERGSNNIKAWINVQRYKEYFAEDQRLRGVNTPEAIKRLYELNKKMRDLGFENDVLLRTGSIDKMKEELSMLAKQEEFGNKEENRQKRLALYNDEIAKLTKEADDPTKTRASRIDAENRLMELTKERGALEEQIARDRYEEAKRYEEQEEAFFTNLYNMNARFRETTQNAISANSEQAIRLQSRSFGSETSGLQAAARGAKEAAEKTAGLIDQLKTIQEKVNTTLEEIRTKIDSIGTSAYRT